MAASANLARLHGERIGHLSRYDSTDLLREELAAVAGLLQAAPIRFAFRKAFFGAGGKEEHWDRYAAPLLEARTSAPAASPLSPSAQEAVPGPDLVTVAEPMLPPSEPMVLMGEDALDAQPDEPDVTGDAEVKEEELPWDQLTAELAETEDSAEDASRADLVVEKTSDATELSHDCSLSVSQIAEHGLAVKVEGSFGAGEYGGSRFLEEVSNAVQAGAAGVMLDLSRLSALRPDCSAPILACCLKLQGVGGRFAVVQPPCDTLAILDATGLTERVDCFEDENSALEFLQPVCDSAPVT